MRPEGNECCREEGTAWHSACWDVSPPLQGPSIHLLPCPIFQPFVFCPLLLLVRETPHFISVCELRRSTIIQKMPPLGRHWVRLKGMLIFSQQNSCENRAQISKDCPCRNSLSRHRREITMGAGFHSVGMDVWDLPGSSNLLFVLKCKLRWFTYIHLHIYWKILVH